MDSQRRSKIIFTLSRSTSCYYNFCREHETLTKTAGGIHTTPAMAAGVADHVWKIEEIVALIP
jgi:hypothetical protein